MGKGNLSGTPWHIEYYNVNKRKRKKRKPKPRSRNRWIYYTDNDYCTKSKLPCFGSPNCPYYRESRAKNNISKPLKKKNDKQIENKNQSILLYCKEDKGQIELFMNGLGYDQLPELHKIAFTKNISDEFEVAGYHYVVIQKFENKFYEESFKILYYKSRSYEKVEGANQCNKSRI